MLGKCQQLHKKCGLIRFSWHVRDGRVLICEEEYSSGQQYIIKQIKLNEDVHIITDFDYCIEVKKDAVEVLEPVAVTSALL